MKLSTREQHELASLSPGLRRKLLGSVRRASRVRVADGTGTYTADAMNTVSILSGMYFRLEKFFREMEKLANQIEAGDMRKNMPESDSFGPTNFERTIKNAHTMAVQVKHFTDDLIQDAQKAQKQASRLLN